MAQRHITVYRKFFRVGDQDVYECERCTGNQGCEIHHIYSRGLPGFEYKGFYYEVNDILNLILVCRDCHDLAHGGGLTKEDLFEIHIPVMMEERPEYKIAC